MDETSPGGRRKGLAACALAAMVAGLVYAAGRGPATTSVPEAAAPTEVASVTGPQAPSTAPPAEGTGSGEAATVAALETDADAAPTVAGAEPAAPPLEAPSFDVVRVSPDGSALVAGRAAPGSMVTILADAAPLAEAEADAEGNFVAIFRAEPSAEPQALTLEAESPDGVPAASDEVVMLLPEAPGEAPGAGAEGGEGPTAAAVTAGATGTPAAVPAPEETVAALTDGAAPEEAVAAPPEEAAPEETAAAPPEGAAPGEAVAALPEETAPDPATAALPEAAPADGETGAAPGIAATAILRGDEVTAAPTAATGGRVTLASISYAEEGEVTLAGLGTAGAVLRVYVDDAIAREAEVGTDGRWSMELGEVAAGVYRLRIDQLGADGEVASRIETPFQRDYPRAPVPRPGAAPAGSVTVQPGNNLWTLARLHYGSGVLYTQIFTANRGLIRDPDLIYPGQIFAMPEAQDE